MVNVPKYIEMVFQQKPGHCTLFHLFHQYRRQPYYIELQPLLIYESALKVTNKHAKKLDCPRVGTFIVFPSYIHHCRTILDLLIHGFSLIYS